MTGWHGYSNVLLPPVVRAYGSTIIHEIDDFGGYADMPWTDKQKAYAAQVTRVDSDMGQLVDTLRIVLSSERLIVILVYDYLLPFLLFRS